MSRKRTIAWALVTSAFNAELGLVIWFNRVGLSRSQAFLICGSIGTAEALLWYTNHFLMLAIVSCSFFVTGFFSYRERKGLKRYVINFFQKIKKNSFVFMMFCLIIFFLLAPHMLGEQMSDYLLAKGYVGLFMCGLIPSFLLPGVIFLKTAGSLFGVKGFFVLLLGNVAKIGIFTMGWGGIFLLKDE